VLPTLSFPVDREKVQGLGSGRFVSIGEWWGSGDRLWSLMKFWYILSAIYLFVLDLFGRGRRLWHSCLNDERGTVFVVIDNGFYLSLHLKAGDLCFWLRWQCLG